MEMTAKTYVTRKEPALSRWEGVVFKGMNVCKDPEAQTSFEGVNSPICAKYYS